MDTGKSGEPLAQADSERTAVTGATTLSRSEDKIIAGVCGGMAERFGWSPFWVRFFYVLISVASAAFPGILFYVLLWVLMPAPRTDG
jgi:phage shock protein C